MPSLPALEPPTRIVRGENGRRVLDTPLRRRPDATGGEPLRPFSPARIARSNSSFAYTPYNRQAIELRFDPAPLLEASNGKHARMLLPLSTQLEVTLEIHEIVQRGPHTFTLVGKAVEWPDSDILLVYNDGVLGGSASLYGKAGWPSRHFEFGAMEDGMTAVRRLEESAFLAQECGGCQGLLADVPHTHGEEVALLAEEPIAGEGSGPVVDVVVGYGREARIADGGTAAIEARILASVDRMNLAFQNSQIEAEIVLLGMIEDPHYSFPGSTAGSQLDELRALNNHGDGVLDSISQLRLDLGADLMTFIVKDSDGSAGLAYKGGVSAIVARTYMTPTRITFAHELGHNFGLDHAWGDTSGETNAHNYGWRFQANGTRRRSIMALDWNWDRAPYFANPNVLHPVLNVPTGAVPGYDARNDSSADPRCVTGGYAGNYGAGYDGSNPDLGAFAAEFILAAAPAKSALRTRTPLTVTHPASGDVLVSGGSFTVQWTGGAVGDLVTIQLWRDGGLVQTLAENLSDQNRAWDWIPEGMASGSGYQIRVAVSGGEIAFSGAFDLETDVLLLPPAGLQGEVLSLSQAGLNWTSLAEGESGHEVERREILPPPVPVELAAPAPQDGVWTYSPGLAGLHRVELLATRDPHGETSVPVTIHHADGENARTVSQSNHGPERLAWDLRGVPDGQTLTSVENSGEQTASWTAGLPGSTTLNGALRIRTNGDYDLYAGNGTLGYNSGIVVVDVDLDGWNVVGTLNNQWFQLTLNTGNNSSVTCGIVLQQNADGLALWGRALGSGTPVGSVTSPVKQYPASYSGPVTLRMVANFTTRRYQIHYRDPDTGGAFVAGGEGVIDAARNGGSLRLRMTQDWSQTAEFIDVSRIRVMPPVPALAEAPAWVDLGLYRLDADSRLTVSPQGTRAPVSPMSARFTEILPDSRVILGVAASPDNTFLDNTVEPGKTYAYRLRAILPPGAGDWSSELQLSIPPSAYHLWAAALDWGDADDEPFADADGDGLANLFEFAFGGNPLLADAPNLPREIRTPSTFGIEFLRARAELTYIIESSENLLANTWTEVARNPGGVGETVSVSLPSSSHPQLFLRVRVE